MSDKDKESFEEDFLDDNNMQRFYGQHSLGHGCRTQNSFRKMIKIATRDIQMNWNEAEGQWSEL